MKSNHAFFIKRGKGKYGLGNTPISKENILLFKHEELLSKYTNDIGFLTANDVIPTTAEATKVSAELVDGTGLKFLVTADKFPLLDKFYSANKDYVTLSIGDATYDRVDLIGVYKPTTEGGLGKVGKIEGDPSANPAPKDYDSSLFYPIKWVLVKQEADTVEGFINETIWLENEGEPNEWTFTTNEPTDIQVVTDAGMTGTYAIEFSNLNSSNSARFTNSEQIESKLVNLITFKIKLKATYKTTKTVNLFFFQGSSTVHMILFKNGEYGFDSSSLEIQQITIPLSTSFSFDAIWLGFSDTAHVGLYVDDFKIQAESDYEQPTTVGTIPTLQQVTDVGNKISNNIIIESDTVKYFQISDIDFASDGVYIDSTGYLNTNNGGSHIDLDPSSNAIWFRKQVNFNNLKLSFEDLTSNRDILLPNKSGTIALLDDIQNLQKEVTTSYTVLNSDNNYTIFFNSATPITITVDDVIMDNFTCDFYNLGVGNVTFVAGTATLGTPDGTVLKQNKVAALIKFMSNNNYKLKGELE